MGVWPGIGVLLLRGERGDRGRVEPAAERVDALPGEAGRDLLPAERERAEDGVGDDDVLRPELALDRVDPALDDRRPGLERRARGELREVEPLADRERVALEERDLRQVPARISEPVEPDGRSSRRRRSVGEAGVEQSRPADAEHALRDRLVDGDGAGAVAVAEDYAIDDVEGLIPLRRIEDVGGVDVEDGEPCSSVERLDDDA